MRRVKKETDRQWEGKRNAERGYWCYLLLLLQNTQRRSIQNEVVHASFYGEIQMKSVFCKDYCFLLAKTKILSSQLQKKRCIHIINTKRKCFFSRGLEGTTWFVEDGVHHITTSHHGGFYLKKQIKFTIFFSNCVHVFFFFWCLLPYLFHKSSPSTISLLEGPWRV